MHQNHHKGGSDKITAATLLVAFGIIYGDIGTSPLYVLKAIINNREITEQLVFGGVSCIFWTLVIQTSIKYVWLTLKADNDGEGGIFSLYALIKRYGKGLVLPTIIGATTLLADGIVTPPISISSAIEGLRGIKGLENLRTVPIVVGIISLLFFFQRFGTHRVGKAFGPVMVAWFVMLFVLGLANVWKYPEVFKALNPYYAYNLLANYPHGFWLLGSVFLCTTGAEALYSDLGHCGKKNIRITWSMVKVCLVLNYMGQSAWVLKQDIHSIDGLNPFYGMMPHWFLFVGIIIATFAAVVASQALISGSYTLINEAMNLNFWPRVTIKQPSESKGQIYIPSVNIILWGGCVFTILYFQSSERMEAVYGLFITVTMIMTTFLLSIFLLYRQKWNKYLVLLFWLILSTVEFSFFVANVVKIEEAWVFLFAQLPIFAVMYTWFYARKMHVSLTEYTRIDKIKNAIVELSEDRTIPVFTTHLIYLTKSESNYYVEDRLMKSIFSRKPKRADVYWLMHINRVDQPYKLSYDVVEIVEKKLIRININVGFRVHPKTQLYFKKIFKDLVANKEFGLDQIPDGSTKYNKEPDYGFVIIERFISTENDFSLRKGLMLNFYFLLKQISLSDERAFGIDKSCVYIERIPLVYKVMRKIELTRDYNK